MTDSARVDVADLQRPPSRLGAWLRRHPVVGDVAVAIVAGAGHVIALVFRGGDVAWWGAPLLAVTIGALMFRRRWPFAVLVVVAVGCAASPLAQPGFGFPMVPFAFAVYTVASRQSTLRAVLGYGVGMLATALATIPYSLSGVQPPLAALDTLSLVALVIGLIVRHRREQRRWLADTVNERIEHAAAIERTRIAAEMHDVVAHSLTMIVSLANGAASIRPKHPDKADAAVDEIAEVGREALADMQRVLRLLRDADADLDEHLHESGGNLPTLDELAARVRAAGLGVTLTCTGAPLPDDEALRHAVYRIVQEALTNALRHARGARQATVRIDHDGESIDITVDDDGGARVGAGAGAGRVTDPGPGLGLAGMNSRAAAFGGHATAGARPDGGWRVHAVLRTPREGDAHD